MIFEQDRETYLRDGCVLLNEACKIENIQELAADVIANSPNLEKVLETHERIKVLKDNVIQERKVLTRLENFVCTNKRWRELSQMVGAWVGQVCGMDYDSNSNDGYGSDWCLYKEKLNLKPAGGTGYAPHLDNPSLMVTGLSSEFVTVMIAIDDMTIENGCLQVIKGEWNERNTLKYKTPVGDPDRDGRAGELDLDEWGGEYDKVQTHGDQSASFILPWENCVCRAGDVFIFNGWLPHRSGPNKTQSGRRAVFLTYNPPEDGDLRGLYYHMMKKLRHTAATVKSTSERMATTTTTNKLTDVNKSA